MSIKLDALSCPLPEDIERLIAFGDLERAGKIIDERIRSPKTPDVLRERLAFERTVMEELPHSYPHSEQSMLRLLQEAIQGFTAEEMEVLRDDGTLDWIYLQGKPYFKDNALQSLIKTRKDYEDRVLDRSLIAEKRQSSEMLNRAMRLMKEHGGMTVKYRLRTIMRLKPETERPGKRLQVYMTQPIRDFQCTAGHVEVPGCTLLSGETHPQRTAYFDTVCTPGRIFESTAEYVIRAPYVCPEPDRVSTEQPVPRPEDVAELLPQIRFTPFIRALAAELKGSETNPLLIARRFYDYVTTNTCYRFVPPYVIKTCIPEYFGAGQCGDCGMHALLFISLCRCVGIPARWQSGLVTRPGHIGCHDWALFYIAPYGWLFADGSFGGSAYREGNLERWNFYFGNLDPYRMVACSALQEDFNPPVPGLRADPYDNQSGEMLLDGRMLKSREYLTEWELLSCEEANGI